MEVHIEDVVKEFGVEQGEDLMNEPFFHGVGTGHDKPAAPKPTTTTTTG